MVFEMETSDPDDFLTLLWLADHPGIDLRGVLVTPGSQDQCRLVRWGLDQCGRSHVPIGTRHGSTWWETDDGKKGRVSDFHYSVFGSEIRDHGTREVHDGPELLRDLLQQSTDMTVLVGAPPRGLGSCLERFPHATLARWVQQGGFAGSNIVEHPLTKFKDRVTCPSWNVGGAWKETLFLLESAQIGERVFVSKNVCHGAVWTQETHQVFLDLLPEDKSQWRAGIRMLAIGLSSYVHNEACCLH